MGLNAPGPSRPYFKPINEVDEAKDIIPVDENGRPIDNYHPPTPWKP